MTMTATAHPSIRMASQPLAILWASSLARRVVVHPVRERAPRAADRQPLAVVAAAALAPPFAGEIHRSVAERVTIGPGCRVDAEGVAGAGVERDDAGLRQDAQPRRARGQRERTLLRRRRAPQVGARPRDPGRVARSHRHGLSPVRTKPLRIGRRRFGSVQPLERMIPSLPNRPTEVLVRPSGGFECSLQVPAAVLS